MVVAVDAKVYLSPAAEWTTVGCRNKDVYLSNGYGRGGCGDSCIADNCEWVAAVPPTVTEVARNPVPVTVIAVLVEPGHMLVRSPSRREL